jgi:hypothetical protein
MFITSARIWLNRTKSREILVYGALINIIADTSDEDGLLCPRTFLHRLQR